MTIPLGFVRSRPVIKIKRHISEGIAESPRIMAIGIADPGVRQAQGINLNIPSLNSHG